LRGRPVLVGSGVVLAASYEARACGIGAPMPVREALRLCPEAVVVDGHFECYLEMSAQVMAILEDATPRIEQISIDEAFLDVSGSVHLLGAPSEIARDLRRRVRDEVGLPISIGIASTKFLAKIASARAKPDGLVVVERGAEIDFLHPLPVEAMWGVGRVTGAALHRLGVVTIGELAEVPSGALSSFVGSGPGRALHALAWNRDPRRVVGGRRAGSVGSQHALGRGLVEREQMDVVVLGIADRIGRRLRKKGRAGSTVTVRVRHPGPRQVSRSHTLPSPTNSTGALAELGRVLLDRALENVVEPVTLIGMAVSGLVTDATLQLELGVEGSGVLDSGGPADLKRRALDSSMDGIRDRFGEGLVRVGAVTPRGVVPDSFRRLGERS
jgi:DNA polymerase IV